VTVSYLDGGAASLLTSKQDWAGYNSLPFRNTRKRCWSIFSHEERSLQV